MMTMTIDDGDVNDENDGDSNGGSNLYNTMPKATNNNINNNNIHQQQQHPDDVFLRQLSLVEEMHAQEMYQLSQQERERIQEEVHGVTSMLVEETPDLITSSLQQFDAHLARSTATRSPENVAYFVAKEQPESCQYVLTNRDMHLKFLRADLFDSAKAVRRYLCNIQVLYKYFGIVALQRPIRFSDLGKEEQTDYKTGHFQVMTARDRAGRLILVVASAQQMSQVPVSQAQQINEVFTPLLHHQQPLFCLCLVVSKTQGIFFTLNSILSEDIATQKLGAVIVWRGDKKMASNYRQLYQGMLELFPANPVRYSAIHLCMPQGPMFHFLRSTVIANIMASGRARTIVHDGKF
jgi:hypothetical protein